MKQLDSRYFKFPFAIEDPAPHTGDRQLAAEITEWLEENDLIYQRDYLRFIAYNEKSKDARDFGFAFASKSVMLQFKLRFAGV